MTGAFAAQPAATHPIAIARPKAADAAGDGSRRRSRTGGRPSARGLRLNAIQQPPRHIGFNRRPIALRHLTVHLGMAVEPYEPIAIRVLPQIELDRYALLIE